MILRRLRIGLGWGFVGVTLGWSFFTVLSREVEHVVSGTQEIRIAHMVLDPGFRGALNQLCRDYEALQAERGKQVKVTPIEIPPNVYAQWARTQLLGQTAPEIMMIQYEIQRDPEMVARYFRTFSGEIEQPNPYAVGTPHEELPWRDTYVDGMRISGYIFALAEHYGIPIYVTTHRMLANRRLLEGILADPDNAALAAAIGPDLIPDDYDQFIALCDAVEPYGQKHGLNLFPIAANKESGRTILDNAVGSQTQQLVLEWPPLKDGKTDAPTLLDRLDRNLPIWEHPAYRLGLQLLREIGTRAQPGYMQLRREDSNFAFATERALMVYCSSTDASSLRAMTAGQVPMVAFPLPLPAKDHPRFGRYAFGPLSEANVAGGNPFGVVNYSSPAKQEIALDFLHYISSMRASQTFADLSGFVPVIADVEPGPIAQPFALRPQGYPSGALLHLGLNDVRNLVETFLYRVVAPNGGVDAFIAEATPAFKERARSNLRTSTDGVMRTSARQDPIFAAYYWLRTRPAEPPEGLERRFSVLIDANDGNETGGSMRRPRVQALAP